MAVFERLLHRRTVLTAPTIDKTAARDDDLVATAAGEPDDVSGFAQAEGDNDEVDLGPEHWEPECGTPVHSKVHRLP